MIPRLAVPGTSRHCFAHWNRASKTWPRWGPLEHNDKFFQLEREKLDAWAEDRIFAAEQSLRDTKLKLKGLKRQARVAPAMDEAKCIQDEIRRVEGDQRRQRQEIFTVEDEIEARRDALIEALEKRLHRASRTHHLFTVRWTVS